MFDEYAKKLKELGEDVPKIFKQVAKRGAKKFVNEAQNITDEERLVDTGYYKRNWVAKEFEASPDVEAIEVKNNAEYASFLEYGHRLRNGARWQGKFVGRRALDETRYYCVQQLDKAFEKAFKKQ